MTHDEAANTLKAYLAGHRNISSKDIYAAINYAITALERQERIKTRLAQIASGDYKACGHTAEEVAKTALAELCGERHAAPGKAIDHSEQALDMVSLSESREIEHQINLSLKTEVQNHSGDSTDMVTPTDSIANTTVESTSLREIDQFDERVAKIQSYLKTGANDASWAMLLWDKVRNLVIAHPAASIGRECFESGIEEFEGELSSLFKDMQAHIRKLELDNKDLRHMVLNYEDDERRKNALLLEAVDAIEDYVNKLTPHGIEYFGNMEIVNRIREEAGK